MYRKCYLIFESLLDQTRFDPTRAVTFLQKFDPTCENTTKLHKSDAQKHQKLTSTSFNPITYFFLEIDPNPTRPESWSTFVRQRSGRVQ